jgi:hypothetical protein
MGKKIPAQKSEKGEANGGNPKAEPGMVFCVQNKKYYACSHQKKSKVLFHGFSA